MRRMIDIVNTVQLDFFDHYLKGKPIPGELSKGIPEIVTRENWIETLTSQNSE